jgi:CBS domain-containing protein
VGILSERDVVRALAAMGADALQAKVEDLMTREVRVCDEDTTMAHLMGLMTEHHIRHLPVVHDSMLVGLVSIGDVVKARLDELELDKKELLDYVSAR